MDNILPRESRLIFRIDELVKKCERLSLGVQEQQHRDDEIDRELPENPHSRRKTLVGASCFSQPLDKSVDAARGGSDFPWSAVIGSRRFCNASLLLLALSPTKPILAGKRIAKFLSLSEAFTY